MSVTTKANACLDAARINVDDAIENLSAIVVDQCWGHDEFNKIMTAEIKRAFKELLDIRAGLK